MRERAFLLAFFAIGGVVIFGGMFLLDAVIRSLFPQFFEFMDKYWLIIWTFLWMWWSMKTSHDYFEKRINGVSSYLDQLKARIEKLELANRG